jgi:hypothetical protein
MSRQDEGRRKTAPAVRRQRAIFVGVLAALGLVAGGVFAVLSPPVPTSDALVVIPNTLHPSAQVVIASSDPVLIGALRSIDPATSLASLQRRIQVRSVTNQVFLISAQGETAAAAEDTANAVADSDVAYENSHRRMRAQVLQLAAIARVPSLPHRLLVAGGLGALLGAIAAITLRRSDRRFR